MTAWTLKLNHSFYLLTYTGCESGMYWQDESSHAVETGWWLQSS